MKPADDELIAYIKESLTRHEEVYIPGAWESFGKKEKKRRGMLWLGSLSSAAAILLIGFILFYATNKTSEKVPRQHAGLARRVPQLLPLANKKPEDLRSLNKKLDIPVSQNGAVVNQRENNNVSENPLIVSIQTPDVSKDLEISKIQVITINPNPPVTEEQALISSPVAHKLIPAIPANEERQQRFQEFLNDEVKVGKSSEMAKSDIKKESKWEMGFVIAPSIGNSKKLNMGYGVSMGYALTSKVSINSGISYNEMGASKAITTSASNDAVSVTALAQESKSLRSVDANLVGIDIPLELKYYLTKNIYTNVGVSAFAVLNQKQNNNYLESKLQDLPADKTGVMGFRTVLNAVNVSEPVPSSEIRDNRYLGFYNISFGYKQKISDSKALSVEPFMKLPIKEVTKENLHLIGTGVRLKFDF